ncbi:agmatinase [Candidatus Woesearchaeota archaeon]|nr:agmatinase [Candidatus Woesearchaeota archaeon]
MATKNPHFYIPFNFGAIPHELADYDKAKVAILPVPYDATTTYQPGTRNGPRALIEASRCLEFYDEETERSFTWIGVCTLDEVEAVDDAERMAGRVYEAVKVLLDGNKKVVVIGGEHSISSGSVKAHKEKYPDMAVLHIDAHADMRHELAGNRFNHGCVARRISEMCPLVSVGVRSIAEEEMEHIRSSNGKIRIFFAKDMHDSNSWMDAVVKSLGENVYITIDLDAFDISIMPSVGTPQPGGLLWYQMLEFMKKIATAKNVVGFDVTELMPIPGNNAPNVLAAKLVYKLIGYFFTSFPGSSSSAAAQGGKKA